MQNGSLIRAERQTGPAVWEFRWRELAGNGKRTHRRIVIGSVDRLIDEAAARQAVSAFCFCKAHRQFDIFDERHGSHQVECLEDHSYGVPPVPGESFA